VSRTRLADAGGDKLREDGGVQDVASVDESSRSRLRKLRKACDGLLCGDKGTVDVDGRVALEIIEGDGKGVVGRGKLHRTGCDATLCVSRPAKETIGLRREGRLTIIDDDARDAELALYLCENINDIIGLGEVARNVELVFGTVGLSQGAGGDGDLVALGGKGTGDGLADVGACAEDEDDGRLGSHGLMLVSVDDKLIEIVSAWSC